MKVNYFYHNNSFKQIWKEQESTDCYEGTDFGVFKKERFPYGYNSVFIFVDHCDFDSIEKVEAIFYGTSDKNAKDYKKKGIIGTGLTATKTVFIEALKTENLGMEDKNYEKLIERLSKDGIEISPHSLRPNTSLSKSDNRLDENLKDMSRFKPATWVDHGYLLYNITRYGWDEKSDFYILDKLLKSGYRFFWSRIDYSLNAPDGNLNLLNSSGRAGKDYLLKFFHLVKNRERFDKCIFVFFWDFLGDLIGMEAKDDIGMTINMAQTNFCKFFKLKKPLLLFTPTFDPVLRTFLRIINPIFYFNIFKNFFVPDKINSSTGSIYPVYFNGKNVFYFNSLWINDCVNCYSPENIDRLIKENGIHIGHNYFCADETHYLNLSFEKSNGFFNINKNFQKNLEHMAKRQKEGKLLVTTLKDYGDFYAKWLEIEVKSLSNNKIKVKNHSGKQVNGISLSFFKPQKKYLLEFSVKKMYKTKDTDKRTTIWFDLKPKEELMLELKNK